MILIHAHIKVKPEKRDQFLEQAKTLVSSSQQEDGNKGYDLVESAFEPNKFLMVEQWENKYAIESHNQTPHFQAFFKAAKELLAEPLQVKKYDVADHCE